MRITDGHQWVRNCAFAAQVTAFLCLLAGAPAFGQTAGTPNSSPTATPGAVPLRSLYKHFLAVQNQLDVVAAAHDQQGKDGSGLRSHYQRLLGFTETQFALIRQSAVDLKAALQEQDIKAMTIIDGLRPPRSVTRPTASGPPQIPPEVVELQNERDALIDQQIAALRNKLGPEAAAKLDTYLQTVFGSNVKVLPLPSSVPPHGAFYPHGQVATSTNSNASQGVQK